MQYLCTRCAQPFKRPPSRTHTLDPSRAFCSRECAARYRWHAKEGQQYAKAQHGTWRRCARCNRRFRRFASYVREGQNAFYCSRLCWAQRATVLTVQKNTEKKRVKGLYS